MYTSRTVDKGVVSLDVAEGACASIDRFDRAHDEAQKRTVKRMSFTYYDSIIYALHAARKARP